MFKGRSCTDKARELDNQERAWVLSVAGYSKGEVASELHVSGRTVQRYIDRKAATFRKRGSEEETAQQVRIQTEMLTGEQAALIRQRKKVESDPNASEVEKLFSMSASSRALATLNKRIAAMNGDDAPTKIVEEQTRRSLNISLTKNVEGRVVVEFDREQLRPKWTPLGLRDCNGHPYERLADRVVQTSG